MSYLISEHSRNLHSVRFEFDTAKPFKALLVSDAHWDSKKCDRALLKKHFDEAQEIGAPIFIAGDWFDAMQGKYDPRGDKSELRPEYQEGAYFDRVIGDSAEFLRKYPVVLIGKGNHETSVLKRQETDMIDRLVHELRSLGRNVHAGGYGGWVRFSADRNGDNSTAFSILLKYFHGSGGGGMMTHGTLSTRRQASFMPDADVIWNGHTHDQWYLAMARERVRNNSIRQDTVHIVRTPGYKDDYHDGFAGWAVERGMPPKPRGSAWLTIKCHASNGERWPTIDIRFTEA